MAKFLIRRVISMLLALFVVVTLTFFLMNLVPGGPFNLENISSKASATLEAKYGLDKPLFEQYLDYLSDLVHGDLGVSIKKVGYTVNEIIGEKFPVSASLGAVAIAISVIVGFPMGILAAMNHNKAIDRVIMFACTIGVSVPSFIVATLLLYVFGLTLGILPTMRLNSPASYVMPSIALALTPLSYIARLTRSSMLEALDQDYIKTARAKGMGKLVVVGKHALRNSVIPVITYMGPMVAGVLSGGFVIENIFSIPGLGKYFVESITARDYPLIMGTTIFYATLLLVMNTLVDLLYKVVDPRIEL